MTGNDSSPTADSKDSQTILIVDDEEVLRQAIAWDFKRKGFKVLEAENGEVALGIMALERVDIVLTDVRMPVCDGVELLRRIRLANTNTPVVIFITGYADLSPEKAFDLGADAVFSKPFDRKQLMARVSGALLESGSRWTEVADVAVRGNFECSLDGELPGRPGGAVHLGRGGLFIRKDAGTLPAPNEILNFRIRASGGTISLLEGSGIVRWVRAAAAPDSAGAEPRGFGLEIQSIRSDHRPGLLELIELKKPRAWIPKA